MKFEEYSYGWPQRVFIFLPPLVLTSVSIFTVVVLISGLFRWTIGDRPANTEPRDIIGGSIGLAMIALSTGFMAAVFANVQPDVRVSDKGLDVQNFLFWWRLVPWEEVKDIRSLPLFGRKTRLIVVRRMTPIHRIIGTIYFAFFQPAFLIDSGIANYDELVHLIKKKIGKELWE